MLESIGSTLSSLVHLFILRKFSTRSFKYFLFLCLLEYLSSYIRDSLYGVLVIFLFHLSIYRNIVLNVYIHIERLVVYV